jgi:hypothetical protein
VAFSPVTAVSRANTGRPRACDVTGLARAWATAMGLAAPVAPPREARSRQSAAVLSGVARPGVVRLAEGDAVAVWPVVPVGCETGTVWAGRGFWLAPEGTVAGG